MNGCEFCGKQESNEWINIQENSRLFCSQEHGDKFQSVLKSLKFHAGWSTVDMLISNEVTQGWNCKAFRGMADLEFKIIFGDGNNIISFKPIINTDD